MCCLWVCGESEKKNCAFCLSLRILKKVQPSRCLSDCFFLVWWCVSLELEEPVSTIFGDLTLYSVPPPASGPVLISMLNIMSTYLSPSYETEEERQLSAQHLVEAMKWAFAQRTQLGDPKYVNVTEIVDEMLSMSHAEWIKTK